MASLGYTAKSNGSNASTITTFIRSNQYGPIGPAQQPPAFERAGVKGTVKLADWDKSWNKLRDEAIDATVESANLRAQSAALIELADATLKETELKVNDALRRRVEETSLAIKALEAQLDDVLKEKAALDDSRARLLEALRLKKEPLERVQNCFVQRSLRPPKELVRDEAEIALEQELKDIEAAVAYLQAELKTTEADLRGLRRAKLQIETDLQEKMKALEIDLECLRSRGVDA
eukprot:tig00020614_g12154.t1